METPVSAPERVNEKHRKGILFAWEMGSGMGHIHRLLPVAKELAERNFRISLALRSRRDAHAVPFVLPEAELLQAPIFVGDRTDSPRLRRGYNYSDVLFAAGYTSRDALEPLVMAWRTLFDSTKPSLIVCDHSPTAILAAAGDIPIIHLGSGFATPPARQPFLPLLPLGVDGAEQREAQVLESIDRVRRSLGRPGLAQVSDLFSWAENFTCTLPELDPYRSVRVPAATGPMQLLARPAPLPATPFLFGYLTAEDPRVPLLLRALVRAEVPSGLFIRQAPRAWREKLNGTAVTLFDEPKQMDEALRQASAVLHHGGVGTAEAALAMGRPQFLLPRHGEQELTARAIEELGCGVNLARQSGAIGEWIQRSLTRDEYVTSALRAAVSIAHRPAVEVKEMIVAACLRHLV